MMTLSLGSAVGDGGGGTGGGTGGGMVLKMSDGARRVLPQIRQAAQQSGGIRGNILSNDDFLKALSIAVAEHLPNVIDVDFESVLATVEQRLQPAIRRLNDAAQLRPMPGAPNAPFPVSQERRVGAGGLVPIVLGDATLAGTALTWSVSGFQGISVMKNCRVSFHDSTGAMLRLTRFAVGTNNRFQIANSAFTGGVVTSVARFREQHPAYQPGEGFYIGTLQLDNSTSIQLDGTVLTGTPAGTQIQATIWGVPVTLPSGYNDVDCSCQLAAA